MEFQQLLKEGNVSIYVRRAGPNYQEGLRIMRELGRYKISPRIDSDLYDTRWAIVKV